MSNENPIYKSLTAEETADKLLSLAESGKRLLIISHVNPDGDTVGCAFATKLIYKALGGNAKCVCQSEAAPYLQFLYMGQKSIEYKQGDEDYYDYPITVDVAAPKQLGKLAEIKDKIVMMIDHHGSGEAFADNWVCPTASACGEMIFSIYEILKNRGKIAENADICRALYAAISSDTGSFRYSNTTSDTFEIAAKLVKTVNSANDGGTDTADIARKLHECRSMSDLRAERIAIDNLKFACNSSLCYLIITGKMLDDNDLCEIDIGGIVDLPRSIEGVLVGLSVKQSRTDPKSYRISSRSNCDIDVSAVCASFGGGGHTRAAGATIEAETPEIAEEIIMKAFGAACEQYKASQVRSKKA